MKKKQQRLGDRILAAVEARQAVANKTWFDKLPEDVRKELAAIRASWKAGEIESSARGLARSIVSECREDGHNTCNVETMRSWLAKD